MNLPEGKGESVFRTYFTTGRGVEALGSNWTFLDLTPLGRQEAWEHSPEGRPQGAPYEWWAPPRRVRKRPRLTMAQASAAGGRFRGYASPRARAAPACGRWHRRRAAPRLARPQDD